MTTTIPSPSQIKRQWLLVDAENQVLGRLASRIALVLRGKHKPSYTPYLDTGDFVVVVNAEKIRVTGKKLDQKLYRTYSGYPDGLKERTLKTLLEKYPARVVRQAVKGMLPEGPLARRMLGKLKVFAGPSHPHAAQLPKPIDGKLVGTRHGGS